VAVRVRVVVTGRVQGVFFRASCAQEARRRGVGGWVRNRPDGSVEAAFEGDATAVESMVEWCRRGPRGARVESVDATAEEPVGTSAFAVAG
jgi:acylphosphatase